jgi:copper chaperone
MACGHCAGAITKAIQAGMPEAKVQADSATKIVRVSGTADLAAVRSLVVRAGYTPIEAMLA